MKHGTVFVLCLASAVVLGVLAWATFPTTAGGGAT